MDSTSIYIHWTTRRFSFPRRVQLSFDTYRDRYNRQGEDIPRLLVCVDNVDHFDISFGESEKDKGVLSYSIYTKDTV